jgi:hypothetical protein
MTDTERSTVAIHLRLPKKLLKELDAKRRQVSAKTGGIAITRPALIRNLLEQAVR